MYPPDKNIKELALKNILKQRLDYIKEIEERKTQLKELELQKDHENYDEQLFDSLKKILKEVENLRNLSDNKVNEISDDVRSAFKGDNNCESVNLLLAEADLIRD